MTACWTAGCEDEATHFTHRLHVDEPWTGRCSTHTKDYCNQMMARGMNIVVRTGQTEARNEL